MSIHFIPEEIVFVIHADLLQRYGGSAGLRDRNRLESALAQPKITVGGRYAHKTIFDGNKRVSFALMDIFLQKNGWEITSKEEEAYSIMMLLASGRLTKAELSSWLKDHTSKISLR